MCHEYLRRCNIAFHSRRFYGNGEYPRFLVAFFDMVGETSRCLASGRCSLEVAADILFFQFITGGQNVLPANSQSHIVLPSIARGAQGPETRERGVLRETRHREAHRLRI